MKLLVTTIAIVLIVFAVGLTIWASPTTQLQPLLPDQILPEDNPNRYSELGAAMAGGAIITLMVLVAERLFAYEAQGRAEVLQRMLQIKSSEFQASLQKEALRFQVGLEKDISGIDLRGEDLKRSYWHEKNVSNAYLTGAELSESYLRGCNFRSAYLQGVDFSGARLQRADFDGSYLGGANFEGANLSNADLRAFLKAREDALKPGATFGEVKLAGANLDRTNIMGADLRSVASLEETENLDKLKWSQATRWPGGNRPPSKIQSRVRARATRWW